MTLPASGEISIASVNTEVGAAATTSRGLDWVQSNTYYGFKDLNSIHSLAWFTAYSSVNSVSRGSTWTTTNCTTNCASQRNTQGYPTNLGQCYSPSDNTNCTAIAASNCNQCGYSHGTYLQGNCNCACNCYVCNCNYNNCNCNCNCVCSSDGGDGATCFPAGSMVLLYSGQWKPIEQITVDDVLMGFDGQPARIEKIDYPVLGDRKMLTTGDITWSEEHPFWARIDDQEYVWSYNAEIWKQEVVDSLIGGLKNNDAMRTTEKGVPVEFAHISGWKKAIPQEVEYSSDTQLYLPFTANGTYIIINGYVVAAGTNEFAFEKTHGYDFSKFKWDHTLCQPKFERV